MKRRPRPILCVAAAGLLALGLLLAAPHVSRFGLERTRVDLHWPRALMAAVCGLGLASAGAVLQTVLRNPLASPYILGISSGASVGALAAIHLGWGAVAAGALSPVSLGALAGSLASAALVYAVARARNLAAETLVLAGVAVSLFGGALVALLHHLATLIDLREMIRWSLGSLDAVGYDHVRATALFVGIGLVLIAFVLPSLEVASLDDPSSAALGVSPARVRLVGFLATSLITAGVVAFAGPVGFVGLVIPHAVRPFTGPDPRVHFPCTALVGAAFLVGCDLLARTLLYPTNLPINVITSAFGCPAFVWILLRRSRRSA
ncbi:MAG: iron ABC transporter permease [Planctomycetota bacterium]|nr:MAG: iron ABC transporter permease [Planctomycetota bacterium]